MEAWIIQHLDKILAALAGATAFVIGWCWRIKTQVNSLLQTRETFKECLPALKRDVAELKTDRAVDKAVLERMEKTLDRIEEKLGGN